MPRNLIKGGAIYSQRSRAGYSEEQKKKKRKGHHAHRPPIFRPKTSKEQKKSHQALRLSFIRISPLLCAFVCEGGRGPALPPPWVRPCTGFEFHDIICGSTVHTGRPGRSSHLA